jgi:hypothetical protein
LAAGHAHSWHFRHYSICTTWCLQLHMCS